jgi:prepilin-type N-terminal cleavage/methylation domain-containing protein
MKINKKGFTLIELLAVIAILAILVVIAVPNILKLFSESRQSALTVDAQSVYEAAQTEWQHAQLSGSITGPVTYKKLESGDDGSNVITLATVGANAYYCVTIGVDGKVTHFSYSSGGYSANPTGSDIKKTDITVSNENYAAASCGS